MSEGSPPLDGHWVPRVPLPQLGAQAPDCTGTQPSLHRGSGSRTQFQSPAHRPTASCCLCLKQHLRRCPCVSLLRALHVIGLLTFAKGPRSPWPHTLTCVSHLGAGQRWSDSGLSGMGSQTAFPTTLGALRPGEQETPEGPLQRWALPPQARKRKNGLPTDLRPRTPALGTFLVCHQTPRGDLGPAQEGGQWAPCEQGLGPFLGPLGMRGCRGGSLVPSPMTLRGPRAVWAAGCIDEVQPFAVMGPPQDESPERSGWGSCAYLRLHITVRETSCLLGTGAESPCSLLVKGPHLGRHRMLGAAPPCPR